MACKVGPVQLTSGHPSGLVHSFSIQDEHGAPILTIGYTDANEANAKQTQMATILQNAAMVVDKDGHNRMPLPKL